MLNGCVPMPEGALQEMAPPARADEPPYTGLGPGAKDYETAHFLVKAYFTDVAVAYSVVCEQSYGRIMSDLGLYSFAPAKPYNIVVYRDAGEFLMKTGQPRWSFLTEGPVRLAPAVADGRVYAGCDDGGLYCLDAETGNL